MIPAVLSLAASFAPQLIKHLAGEKAGQIVEKVTEVAKAVAGTPDAEGARMALLQDPKLAHEFRMRMAEISLEVEKADQQDRENARAMQAAALAQDDKFSKRFVYIFALAWSAVAAGFIFGITFWGVPAPSARFADTVLGFLLGTIISAIIQFFYGSSHGSRAKDELLARKSAD